MMNTRCTKLSMVRDDLKSSKTSNKKCPVVLHGDHIYKLKEAHIFGYGNVFSHRFTPQDILGKRQSMNLYLCTSTGAMVASQ